MRGRVYDPATAQFLTVDPLEVITGAPYSYVGDNPLSFGDPAGLETCIFGVCINPGQSLKALANLGAGLLGEPQPYCGPGLNLSYELGDALPAITLAVVSDGGDDEVGGETTAAPDLENLSPKIERQMAERGWTPEQIQEAYENGEQFSATNRLGGPGAFTPATRYVNPETGQSVVIDDATGEIIQVGGAGFRH